jgi:hypothetical protein
MVSHNSLEDSTIVVVVIAECKVHYFNLSVLEITEKKKGLILAR